MKPKFWQTQKFKELEAEWSNKLKEAGFVDAEISINGNYLLKQSASNSYRHVSQIERESKVRYYELLGSHTARELFSDAVEQIVMQRRSQGVMIKHICAELRAMHERCHRETIRLIIRKYEIKWGIRKRK